MKIYSVSDPAFKPYGKVLTGFTKKIAKGMMALNVEDAASLEKTLAELNK